MRSFRVALILSVLALLPVYGERPLGSDTDGKRVVIEGFGFSLMPPSGWKTELALPGGAENLRYPWFRSDAGSVQFALWPSSTRGRTLEEGFATFLEGFGAKATPFTGKRSTVTLKCGLKAIRAEFEQRRPEGAPANWARPPIVRYFLLNPKGELCFVHIIFYPSPQKLQLIEEIVQNTLEPVKSEVQRSP